MITRLAAVLITTGGLAAGLVLALPAFALAVAPWVGVALVLGVLVAGGVAVVKVRADAEYRAFHAALQADTERFRLRLDAGARSGAIVDAPYYRVVR